MYEPESIRKSVPVSVRKSFPAAIPESIPESIRPISMTKSELAELYFPETFLPSGRKRLMRWIKHCPMLFKELEALGYAPFQKRFTSRQVKLIFYYLGEP